MWNFLKRVVIGLATGWIIVYYGELLFWATPERDGMGVGGIIAAWIAYSVMAYYFLCVVSVFRVRNAPAVFLAGAFYGWFEEGLVVQTMYGSADGPFPMSIAFTGLAWHALLGVFVGWYLVRKVLSQDELLKTWCLASAIGLFYGVWAIWWWIEPPEPMYALLKAKQFDVLLMRFAIYSFLTTSVLVVAHWTFNRMLPFTFRPSKIELWVLGAIALLYFAFITVPAVPRSLWVFPLCMGITFWALLKNRETELHAESSIDAISGFDQKVRPLNYAMLFAIPLLATGVYSAALAVDARVPTNKLVYFGASLVGSLMWIGSVVVVFLRSRGIHNNSTR